MYKLICLLLITGLSFSQSKDVQQLIRDVEDGNIQAARDYLSTLTPSSLTSADLLYLAGLVESDSERAVELYRKIVSDYPDDAIVSDAMMKLGEYYYVSGLYVQAANWFKGVVDDHSEYEDVRRSAKLLLKSLNIAGESEMVREYTQKFLAEIPDLWDDDIQLKSPAQPVRYAVKSPSSASGFFLQVGAFSQIEGANTRADLLVQSGYSAYVEPSESGGKFLNTVLLGPFTAREDAKKTKDLIKKELSLDAFIVQK
ncbi:MAG: SPOR domain-containing protein [Candidatus Marinimicrobia bacterium]|nr:SPOR domain-containing protein [Candidatus Neomarinimicrobiota bacterium]